MIVENVDILEGVPIANPAAIILLKAKAYREIGERAGSKRELKKHLNDIMRLSITLAGTFKSELHGQIKTDIESIIDIIDTLDDSQIKNIMKGYDTTLKRQDIKKILQDFFGI
jgi:hypothetical protein